MYLKIDRRNITKNKVLVSTALVVALLPAVSMSAQKVNSFENDAQNCDSWAWQVDMQTVSNSKTEIKTTTSEQIAFGDQTQNGIGW